MPSSPLRVAVVCSSNQNRSMEAHNILRLEPAWEPFPVAGKLHQVLRSES